MMSTHEHALAAPARALRLGTPGAFAAAAYALAVTMLGTTLPTPLYPIYRGEYGLSELMVTVVFATYGLASVLALLVAGRLSDSAGRRPLLLAGLAFSALSAAAFLAAGGVGYLVVGRALSGLSAGIFTGTATATLLDLSPPRAGGRATLVATMANMGALGLGPLLAGVLAAYAAMPTQLVFWVDLGLLVPATVLVWAMPEPLTGRNHLAWRPTRPSVPASMRAVFVRSALAGSAGFAVLGLFTAVTPGFVGQIIGIHDPAIVGATVFTVFAASTAGQALLVPVIRERSLLAGSAGLIAGMALLALGLTSASLALLLAGGIVAGLGHGLSFRQGLGAVSASSPPGRRGEITSTFFMLMYLAISVPVVGVGILSQIAGLEAAGLAMAGLVTAVAATVIVLLRQDTRPPRALPGNEQPTRVTSQSFLLQRAQPAMTGLIDGSLSTLAPIFAVAIATHEPHYAFFAGLATAIGAGVSMAFSEGLSDTGEVTGRGNPYVRGSITGAGTFLGGILHTLPFLITDYRAALIAAVATIAIELVTLAALRWRLFNTGFWNSFASVTLGGLIIAAISAALGGAAG